MLEDLRANSWSLRPCCMVLAYRVAHFCSVWRKKNVLNNLWAAPLLVLYRIITECFFGYEIKIELHTFGKFSPFTAGNVVNHGFETDKRKLMSALNQMDALVFSSRVDNYPLILCEALSIGVPVIATHSDAAREVLQKSGGKTVSEEEVLQLVQLSKPEIAQALFGTTLAEFSQRSRAAYSGQQMLEEYVNFYQNL